MACLRSGGGESLASAEHRRESPGGKCLSASAHIERVHCGLGGGAVAGGGARHGAAAATNIRYVAPRPHSARALPPRCSQTTPAPPPPPGPRRASEPHCRNPFAAARFLFRACLARRPTRAGEPSPSFVRCRGLGAPPPVNALVVKRPLGVVLADNPSGRGVFVARWSSPASGPSSAGACRRPLPRLVQRRRQGDAMLVVDDRRGRRARS